LLAVNRPDRGIGRSRGFVYGRASETGAGPHAPVPKFTRQGGHVSIRALSFRALFLCLALLAAKPAAAISVIEPIAFASWRDAPGTTSFGAGAAMGILSVDVVPTYEYVFVDNASEWAVNVDAHFPILALPLVALYIGGGVAHYSSSPDIGESSTDTGASVLIGGKMSIRRLKPYGEIKWTNAGPEDVVLTLGMRFHLFD